MSDIVKLVGLFIFCKGAGCNCSGSCPDGSAELAVAGLVVVAIGYIFDRYEK